jgi:hypothetical protein
MKVYQNENEIVNKKPTKINYFADWLYEEWIIVDAERID